MSEERIWNVEDPMGQSLHEELSAHRALLNSFYEKLVLLNGGTVALVVTGVLGPFHDRVAQRRSVGLILLIAISLQVLSMMLILYRNLRAIRYEQASIMAWHHHDSDMESGTKTIKYLNKLLWTRQTLEEIGCALTAVGMSLLVLASWLLLFR